MVNQQQQHQVQIDQYQQQLENQQQRNLQDTMDIVGFLIDEMINQV
jgi:hypothetical protein